MDKSVVVTLTLGDMSNTYVLEFSNTGEIHRLVATNGLFAIIAEGLHLQGYLIYYK